MAGILDGIRVLDFGRYIAGPFCAALLADMGAEVIRIEKLDGSEDRWTTPVGPGQTGEGTTFLQMNRGKLGLTLNPTKPAGREVVRRLVLDSDIVVANLPFAALKDIGLDYDTLSAINPRIILVTNSTFGSVGPYAARVGFDTIGQVMSGAAWLSGFGDKPVRMAAPYVDFMSAALSTVGVLGALIERSKSGKGQMVETALLKSALNNSNPLLIEQAALKVNRERIGNRAYTAGPGDSYRCRDGWIYVLAIGQPLFVRWCTMMGREELIQDPRFKDDLARGDNGEALSEIMQAWCGGHNRAEALELLAKARVPAGPIYTPQEALDDPHVREAGFLKYVEYPTVAEPYPIVDQPVKLSRTPLAITRRPPTLGEHTDEILHRFGYSDGEIAALHKQRVV